MLEFDKKPDHRAKREAHLAHKEEFKSSAGEHLGEAVHQAKEGAADIGAYATEKVKAGYEGAMEAGEKIGSVIGGNVVTVTSYMIDSAEAATEAVKENLVTATEFVKTQVEGLTDKVKEGGSVAGEFAHEAAETAKTPFFKARDVVRDAAGNIISFADDVKDGMGTAFQAGEKGNLGNDHEITDKARRLASGTAEKLKEIPDQVEAAAESFYSRVLSILPARLQGAGGDLSRSWARFKSKLYVPGIRGKADPKDPIQEFVRKMTRGQKSGQDVSNIAKTIYDALYDAPHNLYDGAKESYDTAKEKIANTSPLETLSEAIKKASESKGGPRDFWKSVHSHLESSNHPLADPTSSLSYSPVPITSFYLGVLSLILAYNWTLRPAQFVSSETTKVSSDKSVHVEPVVHYYTFLSHISDSYAWAPMVFFNILVLELNGYSAVAVFSVALVSLLGQFSAQFSSYDTSRNQGRIAVMGVVFASALCNIITSITGFPIL